MNFGCILKVEATGFVDGLDIGDQRKKQESKTLTVLLHVGNFKMETLGGNQVWTREEIKGSIIMKFSC